MSVQPGVTPLPVRRYTAAGGVVVDGEHLLVLERSSRGEVRLPKGHIDPVETAAEAALREVGEESGLWGLRILADLGVQVIEFDYQGQHVIRTEYYFLMALTDETNRGNVEDQFEPRWVTWQEAIDLISYEGEREWVRRAQAAYAAWSGRPSEAQPPA